MSLNSGSHFAIGSVSLICPDSTSVMAATDDERLAHRREAKNGIGRIGFVLRASRYPSAENLTTLPLRATSMTTPGMALRAITCWTKTESSRRSRSVEKPCMSGLLAAQPASTTA